MKYANEKDVKSWQLKCRFTEDDKEKLLSFCEKYNMNISELTRVAIYKYMSEIESNSKSN